MALKKSRKTGANKSFNAIILAAGYGTRLRPLTDLLPKPLMPVCGRPLIDDILMKIDDAGAGKIAVNTHHLAEKIKTHVKKSAFKDRVRLFHEPEILGTGGPLVNARELLSEREFFLLHNGDILSDVDLRELVGFHLDSGALVTMALTDGPENKVLVNTENNAVEDILTRLHTEEGRAGRLLTYMGIAVFSRGIFKYLPEKPENCSIIKAVTQAIDADPGSVKARVVEGAYWNDLGSIRQYFKANEDALTRGLVRPRFLKKIPKNGVIAGPGSKISKKAVVYGFLSAGAKCVVGDGAEVCKCVMLDGAAIPKGSHHHNEIITKKFSVHRDLQTLQGLEILRGFSSDRIDASSLVEQGSDRGFYRIRDGKKSRVLMLSTEMDQDFDRYIQMGTYLSGLGLQTPEIYASDKKEFSILMEDLGNTTLFKYLKAGREAARTKKVYEAVVRGLVEFQFKTTREMKKGGHPEIRIFDYDYLRWETTYFRKNFLEAHCGMSESDTAALEDDFHSLADSCFNHPKIFMHRDFQSQNIMIPEDGGRPRFVDFQGGRIGPLAYDIMSLVKDPYVELPRGLQRELLDAYFEQVLRQDCEAIFGIPIKVMERNRMKYSLEAGLQRIMQALGAYTFLSLKKGKTAYLAFIPFAFEELRAALEEYGSLSGSINLSKLSHACEKARPPK